MPTRPIITLTSDFGVADSYVAQMKGVLLSICPTAQLIDITHSIPPFETVRAAELLSEFVSLYPAGTLHLAVVDPGVGGERRRIILEVELRSELDPAPRRYLCVGPDNGMFGAVIARAEQVSAWEVTRLERLPRFTSGITFEGRNIFSPVIALLANGEPPESFGPQIAPESLVPLPSTLSQPLCLSGVIRGEIKGFDHYGNAATNIPAVFLPPVDLELYLPRMGRTLELRSKFGDFAVGGAGAIVNSQGVVELVVNQGAAREALGLVLGEPVEISDRAAKG